ncbi:hypothetical protein GCM10007420_21960 [Glycocaulis albus]|uniref:HTH cro/C1-type domain-containing protein n=1 Tax=Glycocaulis albus TaxID=1382801 RepID=A0ABQ1XW45_9PROT|nr:helix-turn-helix transcriptional regulator [Glycocaulis albus]GGH05107.1 hypothetical protein GCM10007420_21960 [Glycocaulis albus]
MSFAANLKKYRLKKGYSLQGLADLVGVSKGHVWDLETERAKNPSLEVLTKLSTHLGVPIANLVGEDVDPANQADDSLVMFRELKTLSENDRETIRIMMERLKARSSEDNR